MTVEAEAAVTELTGLRPPTPAVAAVLDRGGWVTANVASMRSLLAPFSDRVGARMASSPVAPVGRRIAGAELGFLLGYVAQRVLGQYDLLVPEDSSLAVADDAVYYVGPNVLEPREAVRVPAARLPALDRVARADPPCAVHRGPLVAPVLPEPRRRARRRRGAGPEAHARCAVVHAVDEMRQGRNPIDEGGVVALFASAEQRETLARVQALMSLLEGHGNAVMNRLGVELVDGQARMARVLQARRNARGATAILHRLLGLELKMKPVRGGRGVRRCRSNAKRDSTRSIAAWQGPELLPTLDELTAPLTWLARVDGASPSRRGRAADLAVPAPSVRGVELDGLVAPVVVACSGGADSLALLVIAADAGLRADRGPRRPRPAARTARPTPTSCATRRAGSASSRVASGSRSQPGGNLEARARDERYAALESVRAELEATAVLVAHTADDQAETVLLNLLRGSGASGLAGMPARRGHVVRPLLGVRRADVHAVCAERGLAPVIDPSNDDRVHRRNWVRLDALPALCEGAAARSGPGPQPSGRGAAGRSRPARRAG